MIVGFNHNVNYKGVAFHVQTEDSGVKSPQLVTLLYHGGTIISSQKTVYADIIKVDNLSQVVEELAKEQHKGMLRRLTKGEFDARIVKFGIPIAGVTAVSAPEPAKIQPVAPSASVADPPVIPQPTALPVAEPVPEQAAIVEEPIIDKFRQPRAKSVREPSLDELIYAYLTGAKIPKLKA
ncbi:MAG: hypothetical protein BA864_00210 [Desulfuromonadales bacterium C00003093]|nr:MAG: hypothetical protein BA864_00210 [Desulfuromonadales bacterium C00003093]